MNPSRLRIDDSNRSIRPAGRHRLAALLAVVALWVTWPAHAESPFERANRELAEIQLKNLQGAVQAYQVFYNIEPPDLRALVQTPDGVELLSEVPSDPWDRPFYLKSGDEGITIGSSGPDGVVGTDDDVVRTLHRGKKKPSGAATSLSIPPAEAVIVLNELAAELGFELKITPKTPKMLAQSRTIEVAEVELTCRELTFDQLDELSGAIADFAPVRVHYISIRAAMRRPNSAEVPAGSRVSLAMSFGLFSYYWTGEPTADDRRAASLELAETLPANHPQVDEVWRRAAAVLDTHGADMEQLDVDAVRRVIVIKGDVADAGALDAIIDQLEAEDCLVDGELTPNTRTIRGRLTFKIRAELAACPTQ